MKPIKRVAVIHDMCSVGKAAMTNILPVFSIMGIEPCPVPTMILSTHTGGFGKPVMMPLPSFVTEAAKHFKNNQIDQPFGTSGRDPQGLRQDNGIR